MQKTARGFFHGCLSIFVFSPYFFRLLLCSAGSAECSFPIKHIPLRVRKLCFRFDVSRKFPGFFFHNTSEFRCGCPISVLFCMEYRYTFRRYIPGLLRLILLAEFLLLECSSYTAPPKLFRGFVRAQGYLYFKLRLL